MTLSIHWTMVDGKEHTSVRLQERVVLFRIDADLDGRSNERWADLQMFSLHEGWIRIGSRSYSAPWSQGAWDTSAHSEAVLALKQYLAELVALDRRPNE